MKSIATLTCIALTAILFIAGTDHPTTTPKINFAALNQYPVVGKLGVPLGTITEIQATIISADELQRRENPPEEFNQKYYWGTYLLEVTAVGGKPLRNTQLLPIGSIEKFVLSKTGKLIAASIAKNGFELFELKHGKKAEWLSEEQMPELEKGFVGKQVNLVVYETGSFWGSIKDIDKYTIPSSNPSFRFTTSLSVLAERKD